MTPLEYDEEIAQTLAENKYYPERLMLYLWDWGESELAGIDAPDRWQLENAAWLGQEMRARREEFEATGSAPKILDLLGSGRGIGKSADIGMLVVALMAAWPDAKISVLANTGAQLATKTWPAIQTWLRRSRVAHWFEINSSILFRLKARDSWFCTPITWSLENPQASAGQHNLNSINVFLFDEMSEIPDKIIEIALAGLVTGLPIAIGRGNPTLPTGVMAQGLSGSFAFGRWHAQSIDSRTCRFPNKAEISEMVEHYGEDSDYTRVWVRGLPPRGSMRGYISADWVAEARKRRPGALMTDALVAGWDAAWGGDDDNCIRFRCGLDAWSIPRVIVPGRDTQRPEAMVHILAEIMTKEYVVRGRRLHVSMLFGDGSGICTEVFAGLYQLGIRNVMAVNWAGNPRYEKLHKNIKAQMMAGLRDLFKDGLGIDDSDDLAEDIRELIAVNFVPLQFEKKEKMKERRGKSSDDLDALAMTCYMPVMLPDVQQQRAGLQSKQSKPRVNPAASYMGS